MRRPNSELFRLLRFGIRFRGWHTIGEDCRKHIGRGAMLDFFEISPDKKRWRLKVTE